MVKVLRKAAGWHYPVLLPSPLADSTSPRQVSIVLEGGNVDAMPVAKMEKRPARVQHQVARPNHYHARPPDSDFSAFSKPNKTVIPVPSVLLLQSAPPPTAAICCGSASR
ncbi:hypothetical protein NP233_g12080 [Leucocoprinus birnbaumii]|uniref:Uncharacterized protein n=1 Tax=Leucocoprinus birnbaumii TaxID=56174 RepID=A0AAD5VIZ4_9AGAR|nr:hypothetical protein NP233_g12080 [Leucocoprinus birnbaumii]